MHQFAQCYAKSRLVIWILLPQKNVTNGQKHFCSFQFTQNPDVHDKFYQQYVSVKKSSGNILSHF